KPASSHRLTGPAAPHMAGGCGGTSIFTGPPPGWNARPAGFSRQPPALPYVVGGSDSVMGYLWARPLYAPEAPTHSNKVLWYVRYPRDGRPLHVTGHLRTDPRQTMSARAAACRDRKSTRLNSSHGSISYAVFCLKKKNALLSTLRERRLRPTLQGRRGEQFNHVGQGDVHEQTRRSSGNGCNAAPHYSC